MVEATEKMKDKMQDSPFSDPKMMEMMTASVKKVRLTECLQCNILYRFTILNVPCTISWESKETRISAYQKYSLVRSLAMRIR